MLLSGSTGSSCWLYTLTAARRAAPLRRRDWASVAYVRTGAPPAGAAPGAPGAPPPPARVAAPRQQLNRHEVRGDRDPARPPKRSTSRACAGSDLSHRELTRRASKTCKGTANREARRRCICRSDGHGCTAPGLRTDVCHASARLAVRQSAENRFTLSPGAPAPRPAPPGAPPPSCRCGGPQLRFGGSRLRLSVRDRTRTTCTGTGERSGVSFGQRDRPRSL